MAEPHKVFKRSNDAVQLQKTINETEAFHRHTSAFNSSQPVKKMSHRYIRPPFLLNAKHVSLFNSRLSGRASSAGDFDGGGHRF